MHLVIEISNTTQDYQMITDFEKLIPQGLLFSLKNVNDMNLIKSDMLKKLLYQRAIEVVKIGNKNFISRMALIAYLEENTLTAIN